VSKKKWSVILAIFFLVQSIASSSVLSFEGSPLNPPTNVDVNYSEGAFRQIYAAVCLGVSLYELDAIRGLSKAEIERRHPGLSINSSVQFDLANMDLGRKGWTRYYPLSIGGKAFIMRIFLTSERAYQPAAPILYEGSLAHPAVTFQMLPSINEIISVHKIRPHRTYPSAEVNRSS